MKVTLVRVDDYRSQLYVDNMRLSAEDGDYLEHLLRDLVLYLGHNYQSVFLELQEEDLLDEMLPDRRNYADTLPERYQ